MEDPYADLMRRALGAGQSPKGPDHKPSPDHDDAESIRANIRVLRPGAPPFDCTAEMVIEPDVVKVRRFKASGLPAGPFPTGTRYQLPATMRFNVPVVIDDGSGMPVRMGRVNRADRRKAARRR